MERNEDQLAERMEDLLRELILRAESPGGEEWLQWCLEHPPQPSCITAGTSAPEMLRVAEHSEERSEAALSYDEDNERAWPI